MVVVVTLRRAAPAVAGRRAIDGRRAGSADVSISTAVPAEPTLKTTPDSSPPPNLPISPWALSGKEMVCRLGGAALGLLHLAASASAFSPSVTGTLSYPRVRSPPAIRANEFDDWWAARRRSNIVGEQQQPQAASEALEMDRQNVAIVLTDFVRSDYAKTVCNHHNLSPTDFGQLSGMFEYVKLASSSTLELKLKRAIDETNEGVLDRVSKYLKERIPAIVEIHAVHRDGRNIY